MKQLRWKTVTALVAALSLVGAACASGSDSSTSTVTSNASEEPASTSQEPADEPAAESNEPAPETAEPASSGDDEVETSDTMAGSSPVGAFFQQGGGLDAALEEYRVKVEEKIVVCMAAQGFEFKQSPPQVDEMGRLQSQLTEREWTAQFGYGISTDFASAATSQAAQPNAQIFFEMSPSEREIWTQVLTGDAGIGAALGGPTNVPLEEQGCIGQAIIETGGGDVIEGMEQFGDAYEEAAEGLNDRREMVDATDAWSRCMSEAGYPDFGDLDDPEADIGSRFQTIVAPLVASLGDLEAGEAEAFIEGDDVTLEDFPNLDVDALRALQAEELETALADLDCYEVHVKDIFEPLRDDLENGLIDEYQGELNALRTIGN